MPNDCVLKYLANYDANKVDLIELVIEQVASFGMPVGKEVFATVFWSGRFAQLWQAKGGTFHQMPRLQVKLFWCHSAKARDSNIWQAMVDRFGPPGTTAQKGKLWGIKSHERAALALAVAFAERETVEQVKAA